MANKRELKKSINYVASDLFQECIILKMIKKADNAKADEVMVDILNLQNEFLARANHPQPGAVKAYYRKLYTDFGDAVESIINKMKEMLKRVGFFRRHNKRQRAAALCLFSYFTETSLTSWHAPLPDSSVASVPSVQTPDARLPAPHADVPHRHRAYSH